jgi:hypothetical protein
MKKRITNFAEELGIDIEELFKIRNTRLKAEHWTGTGKNTYFTDAGQELVRLAIEVPLAVPEVLKGVVVHEARNPRWVYTRIIGREGKVPVAIPRKLRGTLLGKTIPIHEIKDANGGITYRHESLSN